MLIPRLPNLTIIITDRLGLSLPSRSYREVILWLDLHFSYECSALHILHQCNVDLSIHLTVNLDYSLILLQGLVLLDPRAEKERTSTGQKT